MVAEKAAAAAAGGGGGEGKRRHFADMVALLLVVWVDAAAAVETDCCDQPREESADPDRANIDAAVEFVSLFVAAATCKKMAAVVVADGNTGTAAAVVLA
jgi:hypothetical protein